MKIIYDSTMYDYILHLGRCRLNLGKPFCKFRVASCLFWDVSLNCVHIYIDESIYYLAKSKCVLYEWYLRVLFNFGPHVDIVLQVDLQVPHYFLFQLEFFVSSISVYPFDIRSLLNRVPCMPACRHGLCAKVLACQRAFVPVC